MFAGKESVISPKMTNQCKKNKLSQKEGKTFLPWILINFYFESKLIFLLIPFVLYLLVHYSSLLLLFWFLDYVIIAIVNT